MQRRRAAVIASLALAALWPGCNGDSLTADLGLDRGPPLDQGQGAAPWVSIASTRRYFVKGARPVVPLGFALHGEHINLDYFGQAVINGKLLDFPTDHLERYFKDLKARGESLLRIDVEGLGYWDSKSIEGLIKANKQLFLERKPGVLDAQYKKRVDRLFQLARKYDALLMLVLTPHTCDFEQHLAYHPYHTSNGGPLHKDLNELLVKPSARALWKKRLELIVDTWGDSDRIFAWELWNELLNCGGSDPAAAASWVAEMGQHLKSYELARFGRRHLVSVSTVDLEPKQAFFLDSPGTDFILTHIYFYGLNPVTVTKAIRKVVPQNLARVNYQRPQMTNERTLGLFMPDELIFEREHCAAWALIASGAATAGAPWVRSGPYPPFRQKSIMRQTHKVIAETTARLSLAQVDYRAQPKMVSTSHKELLALPLLHSQHGGIVWLQHDDAVDHDIDVIKAWQAGKITGLAEVFYPIQLFLELYQHNTEINGIKDKLVAALVKSFGVSQADATKLVALLQANVSAGVLALRRMLAQHPGGQQVKQALAQALGQLRSSCASFEAKHGLLKKLYRGHPKISGKLTLTGLDAKTTYVATWYDDTTGAALGQPTEHKGGFELKSPKFSRHLLLTVLPK